MNYQAERLRPVAVFATVAEAGTFRRAAEELGLSPPLVSQIVQGLEEDLGCQLIYRSTRRLVLTDAGSRLLEKARPGLEIIEKAITDLQDETSAAHGSLRVTAPTLFVSPAFSRFLSLYVRENPLIDLEVDLSDEHRDPIAGRIDLAIRIGNPEDGDRIFRKLFVTDAIVCGPPGMAARVHEPDGLNDLRFLHPPTVPRRITLRSADAVMETTADLHMVINNAALIRQMVAAGEGFALFPEFTVREALRSGELERLLPDWTAGSFPVGAIYSARRARLSPARHFVDALTSFIAKI